MDEDVAAEDEVGRWKVVERDVRVQEAAAGSRVAPGELCGQLGHDLDSDVLPDRQVGRAQPAEVAAAGVEQHVDAELREQGRQLPLEAGGADELRAGARTRLGGHPLAALVDPAEDRFVARHRRRISALVPIAISGAAAGRSQWRSVSSCGSGRLTQPSVGRPVLACRKIPEPRPGTIGLLL